MERTGENQLYHSDNLDVCKDVSKTNPLTSFIYTLHSKAIKVRCLITVEKGGSNNTGCYIETI